MSKKVIESVNVTKLDIINARASKSYRELVGKSETVKGLAIIAGEDENGEPAEYAYMFAESGEVYGGTSGTIRNSVSDLIDLMVDEPDKHYAVTVEKGKSKSDREFLVLKASEVV